MQEGNQTNNKSGTAGSGSIDSDTQPNLASSRINNSGTNPDQTANMSDSLCTKDRNIRDALEYMKMLQDLTISSGMKEHTKLDISQEKAIVDEAVLRNLRDLDVVEILEKRATDLNTGEKVVLSVHLINQQIGAINEFIQKISAHQEKNFLNAYSGHMSMVMRELRNFKNKINSERFELKKNAQIKNLQAEKEYFQEQALRLRELEKD